MLRCLGPVLLPLHSLRCCLRPHLLQLTRNFGQLLLGPCQLAFCPAGLLSQLLSLRSSFGSAVLRGGQVSSQLRRQLSTGILVVATLAAPLLPAPPDLCNVTCEEGRTRLSSCSASRASFCCYRRRPRRNTEPAPAPLSASTLILKD